MECSTPQIASFLNKLYADEIGAGMEMPVIHELARASVTSGEMSPISRSKAPTDSMPSDKSPMSLTPTSSRYSAPMDVSETFRHSQRISATAATMMAPPPDPVVPTVPQAVVAPPNAQARARRFDLMVLAGLGIVAVVLYLLLLR
jgi:hypothetical protein